jgi:CDP-diacylglycerol--glycerol-3-phosphate 3-phosphatidyltransferase
MHVFFNWPNILSGLRILLTPVFVWLFFGTPQMQMLSIVVFIIAAITDAYDGYIARKHKTASNIGAFLDPMADKILILTTFGVFAYLKFIGWWVVLVFALRDLLITWLRTILIKRGTSLVTSKIAKSKTVLQFVSISLLFGNLLLHNFGYQIAWVDYFVRYFVYFVTIFVLYTAFDYLMPFFYPTCHPDNPNCQERRLGFLKLSYLISTFFYVGCVKFAPGTVASFVTAVITFFLPTQFMFFDLAVILFLLVVGVICSGHIEKSFSIKDPKWIVIDEVLGMFLCLFLLPKNWIAYLFLFLLFRLFDITKIYPISKIEDISSPGWGVMLDDVFAAFYAVLTALIFSAAWFGLALYF